MDNITDLLKSLSDPTRLKIVLLLLRRTYCVGALARHLSVTQAAISQHLKVLREAGLVSGQKKGYFMHYGVDRARLVLLSETIRQWVDIPYEACKPEAARCLQGRAYRCSGSSREA